MSRYISIRGWLECDDDIYTNVIKFINKYEIEYEKFYLSEEQIKYYQKGWVFNNYQIGWRRYIFYGADVKSYNTAFFTKQLEDICQLKFNIDGKFFKLCNRVII